MIMEEPVKPTIKVALSPSFTEAGVLQEVLSGIEEESVPYEVIQIPSDEAVALSYQAALESVLGVGIGLDSKGKLAVHYDKLPSDRPLFIINHRLEKEKLRSICSNSARLTKGTPFIL